MFQDGQILGDFEILGRLGQGGMGAVYKAKQISLDRLVALKTLQGAISTDPEFIARFRREAKAAASLNHPNLVQVHAAGESDGLHWFAMEYVEGESAQARMKRKERLDPVEAIAIGTHIATALEYGWRKAHLIHRDIKPDNIFLSNDGEVKLGDLGLAKSVGGGEAQSLTMTGSSMGTPHYVSPEQGEGKKDVDLRADIYSLGCTLFHLVAGRPPYSGDTAMAVMLKHVTAPVPNPREVWPGFPGELALVVVKMMAKRPADRQQTYAEVIADLRRAYDAFTSAPVPKAVAVTKQPAPPKPPARPPTPKAAPADIHSTPTVLTSPAGEKRNAKSGTRKSKPLLIAAAALLAVIGIAIYFATGKKEPQLSEAERAAKAREAVASSATAPSTSTGTKTTATPDAKTKLAPPPDALSFGGHRYHYEPCVRGAVSWTDAKAAAERLGGQLAVLETREEFDWAARTFGPRLEKQYDSFWIGGSAQSKAAGWKWVNGAAIVGLPWKPPQPDVGLNVEQGDFPAYLNIHKLSSAEFSPNDNSDTAAPHRHWRIKVTGYLVEWDAAGVPLAKQTIDLLALTDPVKDRVTPLAPGLAGANNWSRGSAGSLIYTSDGKVGKLTPPVAINARTYEFELAFKRKNGTGEMHLDLPIDAAPMALPLILDFPGRPFIENRAGTAWPSGLPPGGKIVARCEPAPNGENHVTIAFDGRIIGDWTGRMRDYGNNKVEPHPMFPGELMTSIFCRRDSYEFTKWELRVFEGEAKVLRGAGAAASASTPAATDSGWISLMDKIDPAKDAVSGTWTRVANGLMSDIAFVSRVQIPYEPPEEYDFRITFTRLDFKMKERFSGWGDTSQSLAKKGGQFQWFMGAHGNTYFGFGVVGGLRFDKNPTAVKRDECLQLNRQYISVVSVRKDSVKGYLDGQLISEWRPELGALSEDTFSPMPDKKSIGIGSCNVKTVFHDISVREVTGTGKLLRDAVLSPAAFASSSIATKDAPFVNTLGMKFVPVPITGGPTGGRKILFSIWETRRSDYERFVKATRRAWPKADWQMDGFVETPDHPAVRVNRQDAAAFCEWLTKEDRQSGKIAKDAVYRLPSDHEWSCAVGIGGKEDPAAKPTQKSAKIAGYPWGAAWPPPEGAGNFYGEEAAKVPYGSPNQVPIAGYRDAFPRTAPVGSYKPNELGLYDLGGNVSEWCVGDWEQTLGKPVLGVLRGESWWRKYDTKEFALSSQRTAHSTNALFDFNGFRVVLELPVSGNAASAPAPPASPASVSPSPATATKVAPFANTLGMKFVPVPIGGGPTKGQRVLFGVWDTRVQDYAAYAAANPKADGSWKTQNRDGVPAGHEPDHPVVGVSWEDAQAFCQWLTEKESLGGKLPKGLKYRLPSDEEWSWAVGLPPELGATPAEKSAKNDMDFPWGKDYPPTKKVGNYGDETFHAKFPKDDKDRNKDQTWIKDYTDGYATTSPAGSFPANAFGLCDMGGNVWQWCEDWFDVTHKERVLRGGCWGNGDSRRFYLSSIRRHSTPDNRGIFVGFRCVLAPATSTPPAAATATPNPSLPSEEMPAWIRPELPPAGADGWITVFDGKELFGARITPASLENKSVQLQNDTLVLNGMRWTPKFGPGAKL